MHILNICQLIYSLNTFLRTVWLPVSDTVVFRSCWNLSGGMASICTESTGVGRSASDNRDSCKLCKQNPICTGPCSWGILLGRQESWKTRCFNRILSSHQPKWARAVRDEEGEEAKADRRWGGRWSSLSPWPKLLWTVLKAVHSGYAGPRVSWLT